jgi:hypothetical protein
MKILPAVLLIAGLAPVSTQALDCPPMLQQAAGFFPQVEMTSAAWVVLHPYPEGILLDGNFVND